MRKQETIQLVLLETSASWPESFG